MTVVGIEWTLRVFGIGAPVHFPFEIPGASWWVDWSSDYPPSGTWRPYGSYAGNGVAWSRTVDDLGEWGSSEIARLLETLETLSAVPLVMEVTWSYPTTGLRLAVAARSSTLLGPRNSRLAAIPSWVNRSLLPLADIQEVMFS